MIGKDKIAAEINDPVVAGALKHFKASASRRLFFLSLSYKAFLFHFSYSSVDV